MNPAGTNLKDKIVDKQQMSNSITNFTQLISPQPVSLLLQTKLYWKALNEDYLHIYRIYKSNNKWLRYQAIKVLLDNISQTTEQIRTIKLVLGSAHQSISNNIWYISKQ